MELCKACDGQGTVMSDQGVEGMCWLCIGFGDLQEAEAYANTLSSADREAIDLDAAAEDSEWSRDADWDTSEDYLYLRYPE